ncbi:glucokinase [Pilimelia anulata]|uniref:Glucokinase n=1 Tax=Pilimelia anulata TaxID=53371 RepID=A0A8J3B0V0_9ACTN|nr:ROK family glucokinase [Pilimelia anulata]GGJ85116.1 glucokinase [Pilimelia anulata]
MSLAIGIDIGGTKIAAGVVDTAGRLVARHRAPTSTDDPDKLRAQVIDIAATLAADHPVTAVGIGAAGWIDADRSVVRFGPHLPWRDEPLRDAVAAALGLPVVVENDANVAAWAEYRFGAGDGDSMVLLTVGTGVGGGLVLDGRLYRGAHGIAAELGHVRVVPEGRECPCGRRGCLERYVSGGALVAAARAGATAEPDRAAELLRRADGAAAAITGPMVTAAALADDDVARAAFAEVGHWLGLACADLTQVLDPGLFVIGGGVVEAGDLLLGPARDAYAAQLGRRAQYPTAPIRAAVAGNDAGVIGAADLARG